MEDRFTCSICYSRYDQQTRAPRIIPCANGHTICSECIQILLLKPGSFLCPHDRQVIRSPCRTLASFPPNLELKKLLEIWQASEYCNDHRDKSLDLVCLDCKVKICFVCDKQKHRGHNTELLEEMPAMIKNEAKKLQESLDKISGVVEEKLMDMLNKRKTAVMVYIEDNYKAYVEELYKRKEAEKQQIRMHFDKLIVMYSKQDTAAKQMAEWKDEITEQLKRVLQLQENKDKKTVPFEIFESVKALDSLELNKFLKDQSSAVLELKKELTAIKVTTNKSFFAAVNQQIFDFKTDVTPKFQVIPVVEKTTESGDSEYRSSSGDEILDLLDFLKNLKDPRLLETKREGKKFNCLPRKTQIEMIEALLLEKVIVLTGGELAVDVVSILVSDASLSIHEYLSLIQSPGDLERRVEHAVQKLMKK